MKMELENLEAIHDPGTFRNQFLGKDKNVEYLNNALKKRRLGIASGDSGASGYRAKISLCQSVVHQSDLRIHACQQ